METPELLSKDAGRSAARLIDEMSRLYYLSRALHVIAAVGVADHLGDEPVAVSDLARKTETDAAALNRLLRFLSAYGVFRREAPDRFVHTPLSAVFRKDHPDSMAAILRRIGTFWWSAVGELEHAVRTGESAFDHVHGRSFFQFFRESPEVQRLFDEAMARISNADDAAIATAYPFERFARVVDVGGGRGGLLARILQRAPNARGILFDQPQVVERATRLAEDDLLGRADRVGGDFFQSVPVGGDCYVIKGVLHDFDDDQCVAILSNCRAAMSADGRVVIANQDLPTPIDGPHANLTMDIQMMALLHGRERTEADWAALFARSGLRLVGVVPTDVGFVLVEGAPA